MTTFEITVTVSPLSDLESHRVMDALRETWTRPELCFRHTLPRQMMAVQASAETTLPAFETESMFAKRLSRSIWRRVGRYVKVTVDTVETEGAGVFNQEFDERAYRDLMKQH